MDENFDCTQFITFDYEADSDINDVIHQIFSNSKFVVLSNQKIREVKKLYFKHYLMEYFFELMYDEFLGEFEDWEEESNPPTLIQEFVSVLEKLIKLGLINFKIFLTKFAEEGKTENTVIAINDSDIMKGLFYMSNHNYEVWTDNLIIEIEN